MPELNKICKGEEIGKHRGNNYIYLACPTCGNERWIEYNHAKYRNFIVFCKANGCQQKQRASKTRDALYWDGKSELKVGMLKSQPELLSLGINVPLLTRNMMVWYECPKCHKTYWREQRQQGKYCLPCSRIRNGNMRTGEKSHFWKGGKFVTAKGYAFLTIQPDDPYYAMSSNGKIFEHRYVMAKHLGRLLKSWEIVHHRGIRYTQGSYEDKHDNLIDNLELLNQAGHLSHNRMSLMYHELKDKFDKSQIIQTELQNRVTLLEAENTMLKIQLETAH